MIHYWPYERFLERLALMRDVHRVSCHARSGWSGASMAGNEHSAVSKSLIESLIEFVGLKGWYIGQMNYSNHGYDGRWMKMLEKTPRSTVRCQVPTRCFMTPG